MVLRGYSNERPRRGVTSGSGVCTLPLVASTRPFSTGYSYSSAPSTEWLVAIKQESPFTSRTSTTNKQISTVSTIFPAKYRLQVLYSNPHLGVLRSSFMPAPKPFRLFETISRKSGDTSSASPAPSSPSVAAAASNAACVDHTKHRVLSTAHVKPFLWSRWTDP